jgi:spoIIIJ-associated protein
VVEWVEVRGKSVDVAVAAAMQELGISNRDGIDVEVIQEPERGFLGLGGRDAIVRVKPRPISRNRRRKRGRGEGSDRSEPSERRPTSTQRTDRQGPARQGGSSETGRPGGRAAAGRSVSRGGPSNSRGNSYGSRTARAGSGRSEGGRSGSPGNRVDFPRHARTEPSTADPHAQAPMVEEFLTGLLDSFGLDGRVVVVVEDEVIVVTIEGEQSEALVGPRGSVMEAIHEITKTVLHRQEADTARVRIDIAGYAERRRQALSIYASQLIDQVLAEGGEIMLEPMSASDRKVIHDAVGARDGVESYSEGEPPRRYVVIATTGEESVPGEPVDDDVPDAFDDELDNEG